MNGGTCYPNGESFKCVCTGSYTGATCQECKYFIILPSPTLFSLSLSPLAAFVSFGPTIIRSPQPVSSPLFSPVNLSCIVEGNPTPRVDWYKDDQEIVGQHNTYYYISGLRLEDRGEYRCTATNQLESPHVTVSSTPALVTINSKREREREREGGGEGEMYYYFIFYFCRCCSICHDNIFHTRLSIISEYGQLHSLSSYMHYIVLYR